MEFNARNRLNGLVCVSTYIFALVLSVLEIYAEMKDNGP